MKLRYTRQALQELDEVLTYVSERSPRGANRISARLAATVELLTRHPESGVRTRTGNIRRIAATPYPYLIFYEVDATWITILGVRHAARDPLDAKLGLSELITAPSPAPTPRTVLDRRIAPH